MIVFYRGVSWVSRVIQWQTRSPYSHVGWMRGDGSMLEAWHIGGVRHNRDPFVMHTPGTLIDVYAIRNLTAEQHRAIEAWLLEQLGLRYDFLSIVRFLTREPSELDDAWFCSEMVAQGCTQAGRTLLHADSWRVDPGHLAWSTELEPVALGVGIEWWRAKYKHADRVAELADCLRRPITQHEMELLGRGVGMSNAQTLRGLRIVEIANRFVGLRETRPNAKWDDIKTPGPDARASELRALLLATGHQDGWPYCMSFAAAVWLKAYEGKAEEVIILKRLFNPSVMATWGRAKSTQFASKAPVPGSIFFMQYGASWRGHAGIVTSVEKGAIRTIEANTSPAPGTPEADREGDGIFAKRRTLTFAHSSGLHLVGFLNPIL